MYLVSNALKANSIISPELKNAYLVIFINENSKYSNLLKSINEFSANHARSQVFVIVRELVVKFDDLNKEKLLSYEANKKRNLDLYHRLVLELVENFKTDLLLFESLFAAVQFIVDLKHVDLKSNVCFEMEEREIIKNGIKNLSKLLEIQDIKSSK